jgi:hypothetical protein
MADVRGAPGYAELDPVVATFTYDGTIVFDASRYDLLNGSAQVGDAVVLVAGGQVGLGATGGRPIGKLIKVERDVCAVQIGGVVGLPYLAGSVPAIGRGITVDGAGNAQQAAGGSRGSVERGEVLYLDTTNLIAYVWMP